jgi:hypothetical protein
MDPLSRNWSPISGRFPDSRADWCGVWPAATVYPSEAFDQHEARVWGQPGRPWPTASPLPPRDRHPYRSS